MDGLAGVNLAVQTPFKDDGSIDYHRWEALLDVYADSGVHGILLSSGTGQHAYLTEAECNELLRTGVRRINGRTRILCQTSALNLEEVIRRSKTAEALGAEAVLILPPFFEGPTHDDGIFAFYERIDRELGIDVIGYNIPQATNITLTPKLYHRLLSLKNFKYIKESSGNLTRQQALISDRRPRSERSRLQYSLLSTRRLPGGDLGWGKHLPSCRCSALQAHKYRSLR